MRVFSFVCLQPKLGHVTNIRNVVLRLPLETHTELLAELQRKYAPMKPPSLNSVFAELVRAYVVQLRAENDAAGR